MRGVDFQPPTAFDCAVTDCAASTVSTAEASLTVFSTSSPSVVGVTSGSIVESETSFSSAVVAATDSTRADRIAGSDVNATAVNSPARILTVPSLSVSYSSNETSTLNPSRKPSCASTSASLPAVVCAILNVASIPSSLDSIESVLPIRRVRSCSRLSKTEVASIEPLANCTLPIEALPVSSNVTMRPEIVRLLESAAVIVMGVITFFIAACLLPRVFRQLTLRQFDLGFHKPARARKDCHARNHLGQTKLCCLLA